MGEFDKFRSVVGENLKEHFNVLEANAEKINGDIIRAAQLCLDCLSRGRKILLAGNGGSAADCQHIAAELVGRFVHDRRALRAIALTTDSSALTCISNDFGYDQVFSRQVEALIDPGDVLLIFSTSGNSQNLVNAANTALTQGAAVYGFLGKGGGDTLKHCTDSLVIESSSTARIQELHILCGHILCELIEKGMGLA
ncbi:SIS domain-containing protein [Pseudomonadales bacterium]|nr:SIS domain-containing protein [Pseudomonadales bacterium]